MILPKLRSDLDIMPSPVAGRPGLLIRDVFRFSPATLIIPPPLIPALLLFNGIRTIADLQAELARSLGSEASGGVDVQLREALSQAGFLEDDTHSRLKRERVAAFAESPTRPAAHAGTGYPAEIEPLRQRMRQYLDGATATQPALMGIAAPHVSPEGGWQAYRAAYKQLTPDLRDRTFVVLGTSHYGQPDRFGLTRKPFETPFGNTRVDLALVEELEAQPAALVEDYCHAIEHSIEFQVIFLQSLYGADIRILPLLCGSFGRSIRAGGFPEDNQSVQRFLHALGAIAEREQGRLFWVLGVDMAHIGTRYGDTLAARANQEQMLVVKDRDLLRIERVNASDARGFWELVKENQDDLKWCGSAPIYTFMKAVPQARGTLRHYQQWNIDERSVVSFAGITFTV